MTLLPERNSLMRKTFALLAISALAPLGLVACGGSSDSSSSSTAATSSSSTTTSAGGGGGGGGVALAADPSGQLAYDTTSLSAPAGDVTIDFENQSQVGHDVCVKSSSGDELGCSDIVTGDSTTLDAGNLKPGDYTFYCSVDGHEAAGMQGTLTVK
jgi:plastocyanin